MWHDEELQELLRRQDDTQKESELRKIMKQIKSTVNMYIPTQKFIEFVEPLPLKNLSQSNT